MLTVGLEIKKPQLQGLLKSNSQFWMIAGAISWYIHVHTYSEFNVLANLSV